MSSGKWRPFCLGHNELSLMACLRHWTSRKAWLKLRTCQSVVQCVTLLSFSLMRASRIISSDRPSRRCFRWKADSFIQLRASTKSRTRWKFSDGSSTGIRRYLTKWNPSFHANEILGVPQPKQFTEAFSRLVISYKVKCWDFYYFNVNVAINEACNY